MKTPTPIRCALIALAIAGAAGAAQAQDHYTRLFEMQQMDRNKDGMVSKAEFLAMVSKLWDMQMAEGKIKGGLMDPEHIKSLERVLGRTLSSAAGA